MCWPPRSNVPAARSARGHRGRAWSRRARNHLVRPFRIRRSFAYAPRSSSIQRLPEAQAIGMDVGRSGGPPLIAHLRDPTGWNDIRWRPSLRCAIPTRSLKSPGTPPYAIPDGSEPMQSLLDEYEHSELAAFHDQFYSQLREDGLPPDWSVRIREAPLCAQFLVEHPNDWLLKPAALQHRRASAHRARLEPCFHRPIDLAPATPRMAIGAILGRASTRTTGRFSIRDCLPA